MADNPITRRDILCCGMAVGGGVCLGHPLLGKASTRMPLLAALSIALTGFQQLDAHLLPLLEKELIAAYGEKPLERLLEVGRVAAGDGDWTPFSNLFLIV